MEVAIALFLIGIPGVLVGVLGYYRMSERLGMQALVRAAAESQQPLSAEVIRAVNGRSLAHPRERDRRRGVMLVSVGSALASVGALAFTGLMAQGSEAAIPVGVVLGGLGAFPGFLGAGYIILSRGEREDVDA